MSFSGNQYPNNAAKVITTRGDIVRGNSSGERSRYGIGAANTVLTSDGTDPSWAAHGGVPTTTKGDISGFSTTQARIPISTNNYSLLADSAQTLGLKWAASSTSVLSTTGDILAASSANVLSRIQPAASGTVLTSNGAGVAATFQAAGGGGGKVELVGETILGSAAGEIEVAFSAISRDDISKLFCVSNTKPDDAAAAGQNIQMQVNSLVTNYTTHGSRVVGGVESLINESAENDWTIYNNNLGTLADGQAIFIDLISNLESSYIQGYAYCASTFGGMWVGIANTTSAQDSFDSVLIHCNAGNNDLQAGSSLTVYRVND